MATAKCPLCGIGMDQQTKAAKRFMPAATLLLAAFVFWAFTFNGDGRASVGELVAFIIALALVIVGALDFIGGRQKLWKFIGCGHTVARA